MLQMQISSIKLSKHYQYIYYSLQSVSSFSNIFAFPSLFFISFFLWHNKYDYCLGFFFFIWEQAKYIDTHTVLPLRVLFNVIT